MRKKNVYLFVSTLDITDEELSVVLKIHEAIKTKNQTDQYKIVWVPIVEEWTDQLRKKFEILKAKVSFYVVEHFGSVAGFKYIKEEWQFKKKPMVVTMNHQGKILHHNAFHLIQAWGIKAFPFTKTQEDEIHTSRQWVAPIVSNIHPNINTWVSLYWYKQMSSLNYLLIVNVMINHVSPSKPTIILALYKMKPVY